jgi:hypothetical protein
MGDPQQSTPILTQTLAQLDESADALDQTMGNATTPLDVYRAATEQKEQIEQRISTLENLQLAQDTKEMQALVPALAQAKTNLDGVLGKISKASEVVDGVTKFLAVVDALVSAAKAVASA